MLFCSTSRCCFVYRSNLEWEDRSRLRPLNLRPGLFIACLFAEVMCVVGNSTGVEIQSCVSSAFVIKNWAHQRMRYFNEADVAYLAMFIDSCFPAACLHLKAIHVL